MKLNPFSLNSVHLGVVVLSDRLAVAALDGERVEAFSIDAENPAAVLREELSKRQLAPRLVALGLARGSVFVKPIELPSVGGDLREMVRLNLDGYLPFAAEDAPFDFLTLPAPPDAARREEPLLHVLVAAAEPRVADAALRIAEEARLRPVSLTVAAHDLLALARPERDQKVIWVHRAGLRRPTSPPGWPDPAFSRSVLRADDHAIPDEIRRSLAVVRWRSCDAVWFSGDVNPDALGGLDAPVGEPDWSARARARLAALPLEDPGVNQLALAVAMGGMRRARPLDLLPLNLRPRRLSRAQMITAGIAAATVLIGLGALLVPGFREQRYLGRINAEISRVDPEVKSAERVVRELERKRKLVATVTGIEAAAMRPLPVLRELTDLLPTDAWLTTLSFDQKGVELTGQAAAASALIPILENSPRLERVEFASPVTRGRDKEQFRIRAAWEVAPVARSAGASAPGTPAGSPAAGGRPGPPQVVPGARQAPGQRQPPPAAQVPVPPPSVPAQAPPVAAPPVAAPPGQPPAGQTLPVVPPAPAPSEQVQPGQPPQSPPGRLAPARPGARQ
jgi:Tfp pilus assembly protein PilN